MQMHVYFTFPPLLCYQNDVYRALLKEFTTHQIIWFLDVREHTTSYAYHPKELIDIIARVSNKSC